MPHGDLLTAFTDAALGATSGSGSLERLRNKLRGAIGDAGYIDVCATLASFNAVVKLADGTGIPLEGWKAERTRDLREVLDIDKYRAG